MNKNNSITSSEYSNTKKLLDDMLEEKEYTTDELKKIEITSQLICGLFVAIKDNQYREKALYLLNKFIELHTFDVMLRVLRSKEVKTYGITSMDVTSEQRREIVSYMFSQLLDPNFYYAVIYSMGFYITPDVLSLLEQYAQNNNPVIKKEAEYAIEFIRKKREQQLKEKGESVDSPE